MLGKIIGVVVEDYVRIIFRDVIKAVRVNRANFTYKQSRKLFVKSKKIVNDDRRSYCRRESRNIFTNTTI